jgi:RNA polymerase I-specific transcription initiation factor RRN7
VKGFPKELETVVRDIWGLRLRVLHKWKDEGDGFGSGVSLVGLSDTSEGETGSDATDGRSLRSGTSSRSIFNRKKKLPKLVETLALCYLGTLLMRLPTSLGEIFKWASREEMIFTKAVSASQSTLFCCMLIPDRSRKYQER